MKVSIITTVFNNAEQIRDAIMSVALQEYDKIEYIIIDGGSTDGTLEIIEKHDHHVDIVHTESDNGIYDGLNRGIGMATGEIIGILHSDDMYENYGVIAKVVEVFKSSGADAVYGDLVYVQKDQPDAVSRYWKSGNFDVKKLKRGWMPPHPTFFAKREIFQKHGSYDSSLKIAADYDFMLRVLNHEECSVAYVPEVLYRMRTGGASNRSLRNILQKSSEDLKVMRRNNVGGLRTLMMKNISKVPQFILKKRKAKRGKKK